MVNSLISCKHPSTCEPSERIVIVSVCFTFTSNPVMLSTLSSRASVEWQVGEAKQEPETHLSVQSSRCVVFPDSLGKVSLNTSEFLVAVGCKVGLHADL